MPLTPSTAAAAGPRRRSLLAGALGTAGLGGSFLVAGCTDDSGSPDDPEHSAAVRRARRRAARESESLLARYDGTAAAHTALAPRLRPLRDAVARHAQVLRAGADGRDAPSSQPPSGSPSPGSPRPSSTPGPSAGEKAPDKSAVPDDEKKALAALAGAERRLADSRTKALVDAPPELARLLASIAASGAAHAWLLDEGKHKGDEGGKDA